MYVCSLKIFSNSRMLMNGHNNMHAQVVIKDLRNNPILGSNLVYMYARCGLIEESQAVCDNLLVQDAL